MRGSPVSRMYSRMASLIRRCGKITAHPYEGLPLIVVTGVGRSGTTALRHCLSAHPDLHSTGNENNIIFDVLETARLNCTYPSRKGTMHVAPAAYDRQFRLLLLNLLWPEPKRGKERPKGLLATSDLTPNRADYLLRVFPTAGIVYIVRNGISVVSSRITHPNFRNEPLEEHCRRWAATREMAEWGSARSEFVLIRQEDLLTGENAEGCLRRALDIIDLSYDQTCLTALLEKRHHPTRFEDEKPEHAADLRKRAERWRLWSEEHRSVFEQRCAETMRFFGYPIPWLADCGEGGDGGE